MGVLSLRWLFLLAAVGAALRCVFLPATPARVGFAAACGTLWFWLSRRKIRSIDRDALGIRPRD